MVITEEKLNQLISHSLKNSILNEYQSTGINDKHIVDMLRQNYLAHGTTADDFDEFSEEFIKGGSRGIYGYGFYFTDALYKCVEYGNNIIFTPKNEYKFLPLDGYGQIERLYDPIAQLQTDCAIAEVGRMESKSNSEYDYYTDIINSVREQLKIYDEKVLDILDIAITKCKDENDEQIYKFITSNLPMNQLKKVSHFIKTLGFDGVKCGNQYCIFNSEKLNANLVK